MIPDIPRSRASGEAFDDEREALAVLLEALADPTRTAISYVLESVDEAALLEITLGLLRAQIAHASAVQRLLATEDREAAYPIVRTMLEIWSEISYLNIIPPASTRVWGHRLWALLVLHDGNSDLIGPSIVAFEKSHPDVFALAQAQFKRRRTGHFSGLGRATLINIYCGAAFGRVYQYLSYSCHPIVQGVTHLEFANTVSSGDFTLRHFRPVAEMEAELAVHAVMALMSSWDAFYASFGSSGTPA